MSSETYEYESDFEDKSTTSVPVNKEASSHHYRISVDLRSIRLADTTDLVGSAVSLRYTYPIFNMAAPFQTGTVNVPRKNAVELPLDKSFTAFELICSPSFLQQSLEQDPLIVEVVVQPAGKAKKAAKPSCVGMFSLALDTQLLNAPLVSLRSGQQGSQACVLDTWAPVSGLVLEQGASSTPSAPRQLGAVWCVLSLEDFGVAASPPPVVTTAKTCVSKPVVAAASASTSSSSASSEEPPAAPTRSPHQHQHTHPPHSQHLQHPHALEMRGGIPHTHVIHDQMPPPPHATETGLHFSRGSPEYQVAWELEMWRRAETKLQQEKWADQEQQRMQQLEDEWKKHGLAREQAVARRKKELAGLETQLKEALFDVEKQERRLLIKADELKAQLSLLDAESKQSKQEAMLTVRRMKEQHEHEVALLQHKFAESKKTNRLLKAQLEAAEAVNAEREEEFRKYRTVTDKTNNGKLRALVLQRDGELKELAAKLDCSSSKEQAFADQLQHCLAEIARLRKLRVMEEEQRLADERADLERLRLSCLSRQQCNGVARDKNDLISIKDDLHALMKGRSLERGGKGGECAKENQGVCGSSNHGNSSSNDRISVKQQESSKRAWM